MARPEKNAIAAGQRFGRLMATGVRVWVERPSGKNLRYECICNCGATVNVRKPELVKQSGTVSCGCHQKRRNSDSRSSEYRSWAGLIDRCYNTKDKYFYRYGGRGIRVCDRWRESYANFLADIGRKPCRKSSIERIDNDADYSPQNCVWANSKTQANNRHTNRVVEYQGQVKTLTQWASVLGFACGTLRSRLVDYGMTVPEAFTTPINGCYREKTK